MLCCRRRGQSRHEIVQGIRSVSKHTKELRENNGARRPGGRRDWGAARHRAKVKSQFYSLATQSVEKPSILLGWSLGGRSRPAVEWPWRHPWSQQHRGGSKMQKQTEEVASDDWMKPMNSQPKPEKCLIETAIRAEQELVTVTQLLSYIYCSKALGNISFQEYF